MRLPDNPVAGYMEVFWSKYRWFSALTNTASGAILPDPGVESLATLRALDDDHRRRGHPVLGVVHGQDSGVGAWLMARPLA